MRDTNANITDLRARLAAAVNRREKIDAAIGLSEALRSSDPEAAVRLAEEALQFAQTPGYEFDAAHCEKQIGLCLLDLSEYGRAYNHLLNADKEFEDRDEHGLRAEVALAIGGAEIQLRRYRSAGEWLQSALELYRRVGDRKREGSTLRAIGSLHAELDDYEKALQIFHEALEIVEKLEDRNDIGMVLSDVAIVHGAVGEHERALEYFERSKESFVRAGNHFFAVRALTNISRTHLLLDRSETALEIAEQARGVFAELGERRGLADLLEIIGYVHETRGELTKALDHHRKRLEILIDLGDEDANALALLAIGKICQQMGDHSEAWLALESALHIVEQTRNSEMLYQIHDRLAATMKSLGDAELALYHRENSISIREEVAGLERQKAIAGLQIRYDLAREQNALVTMKLEHQQLQDRLSQTDSDVSTLASALIAQRDRTSKLRDDIEQIWRSSRGSIRVLADGILTRLDAGARADETWLRKLMILRERYPDLNE